MQNPIADWCIAIIEGVGGLQDFQRYEMAVENYPHDVCVAMWVIRCLANPHGEDTQMVLDAIVERRKEVEAAKVRPGSAATLRDT